MFQRKEQPKMHRPKPDQPAYKPFVEFVAFFRAGDPQCNPTADGSRLWKQVKIDYLPRYAWTPLVGSGSGRAASSQ